MRKRHKLDHDTFELNAARARDLTKGLAARGGIPEHRRRYFTDPDHHPGGRNKSRQQVFERNGCLGDDILMHAHFLPHLRYFVHGPDLPEAVTARFVEAGTPNRRSGRSYRSCEQRLEARRRTRTVVTHPSPDGVATIA